MSKLTTDDWVAVNDHMGDYCWKVDEGDADGWVALWTEDGVFAGVHPEPVQGHANLRNIPLDAFRDFKGGMRHFIGNITCCYGESRDEVIMQAYNYVSMWGDNPGRGNFCMALCRITLVRNGEGWLVRRNDTRLLV